jgi:hypothetical protein
MNYISEEKPGAKSIAVEGFELVWKQPIVRVTIPLEGGTYIFSLLEDKIGWIAEYFYYPTISDDEASDRTCIASERGTYEELFALLKHWAAISSFCGYDSKKSKEEIVRVKDIK